jgi:adenylate cyclase
MKEVYNRVTELFALVVIYIVGLVFFRFLMFLGTVDTVWVDSVPPLILNLAVALNGLVVGIGMAFIEFRIFPRMVNLPTHTFMALRFLITITTITLGIAVVHHLFVMLYFGQSFGEAYMYTLRFMETGVFWALFIYLVFLSVILNIFKVVHHHIGPNAFVNYVTGKYRIPQEENRVFIFIDLKSSTSIAEQLGHVKYSRFLNTFFNDLTEIIARHQGEVYQFVGDEAVLTWRIGKDEQCQKCIQLFYDFKDKLYRNRSLYEEKFGVFPEFKASIHVGLVSASESQGRKRELVYHGDVLNTCARILELCSRLKKDLLLSEPVAQWIIDSPDYTIHPLDAIMLRGKGEYTSVFEVVSANEAKHTQAIPLP